MSKRNGGKKRCVRRDLTLLLVLDTCVLKLATLPGETNYAALIVEMVLAGRLHATASPAMLEEYGHVLSGADEFLTALTTKLELCFPLTTLRVIRHSPDNRFLECALAAGADWLLTVNTAPGQFDRAAYGQTRVTTPGRFLRLPEVQALLRDLP